jgi:hypothetical protein
MDQLESRFEDLHTASKRATPRSASAILQSPPPFRLAGIFRSQSRTWTEIGRVNSAPQPQPGLLRKKQKMHVLG